MSNEIIAPKLSKYFEVAFNRGFFPQILKTAKVVPIFKSGDKNLINNYRPIYLLPSLSKVLKKLIKIRFIASLINIMLYMTINMAFEKSTV